MKILLTGAAGFIGMHTAQRLLQQQNQVLGVDNLNNYYDPQLKQDRLACIAGQAGFRFEPGDITDSAWLQSLAKEFRPEKIVHLAAQAGVRHSIDHPMDYINSNVVGFMNILELCRNHDVTHLVYASSSSVYGNNTNVPFSEHDPVDHPLSMYAASKRANELMAHVYSHLHGLPTTGLRFFTVYGPWGRPDMAPIKFARAIRAGETIGVFNAGDHQRDFTYIDDIVSGVVAVVSGNPPGRGVLPGQSEMAGQDPSSSGAPFRLYNIGNNSPIELMAFLAELENSLGARARLEMLPAQPGDVHQTWADCSDLQRDFNYHPDTPLEEGVRRFVKWFNSYYGS